MAEAKKVAPKTYQSKHPGHSTSCLVGDKRVQLNFTEKAKGHGELTSDVLEVQEHIERMDAFKTGVIRIKWSLAEKAEARVKAAKTAVKDAQDALKAAESELADLKPAVAAKA